MSCRSRSSLLSSKQSLRLKTQDTRPHPESTHAPTMWTLAPAPPTLCDSCPPLKDRKVSLPRGRLTLGSEPVCCKKSIKFCGAKMHSQAISVSPRTLHGAWRDTQRGGGGTIQAPNSPCRGAARYTQLTSPRAFQGRPDARVRTHRLSWDSGSAHWARRGWDRVTARELQVTRVCAQRPGRSVLPLS